MLIDTGSTFQPKAPVEADGSGFARHGITHLSASSLNLWRNAPDVWVAKYLHGFKGTFGPAPVRGQCVEDLVAAVLQGANYTAAHGAALDRFDSTFPKTDDATAKERAMISGMARQAIDALAEFGTPDFENGKQHKISIRAKFDAWEIEVIGFLDFVFPDRGLVVDLKTTTRVPSTMSADHRLQRAIYAKAKGNMAVKFLYASDKKTAMLEDGDVAETLGKAKHAIARLERFLAHHDAETALACVPHNPDSFYWRGDEAARFQFFGT